MESSQEISQLFNLGEFRSTLIKGKDINALCVTIGENKISIFMEKDVDHENILNSLQENSNSKRTPSYEANSLTPIFGSYLSRGYFQQFLESLIQS
jgi:hypothetical protein